MAQFKHIIKFIGVILGVILGIGLIIWVGIDLLNPLRLLQYFLLGVVPLISLFLPGIWAILLFSDYIFDSLTRLQIIGFMVGSYILSLIVGIVLKYYWYGGDSIINTKTVASWFIPLFELSVFVILGTALIFAVLMLISFIIIVVCIVIEYLLILWEKLE